MKIFALFIVFYLASLKSFSQTITVNVDKFTGDTTLTIKSQIINSSEKKHLSFSIDYYSVSKKFLMTFRFKAPYYVLLSKGEKALIKLSDGDFLTFNRNNTFKSYGAVETVFYSIYFDKTDLKLMKGLLATDVRFEYDKGNIDFTIDKSHQSKIVNAMEAMINRANQ